MAINRDLGSRHRWSKGQRPGAYTRRQELSPPGRTAGTDRLAAPAKVHAPFVSQSSDDQQATAGRGKQWGQTSGRPSLAVVGDVDLDGVLSAQNRDAFAAIRRDNGGSLEDVERTRRDGLALPQPVDDEPPAPPPAPPWPGW